MTPIRVAVIFNPASGGRRWGSSPRRRQQLRAALATSGAAVLWYETDADDPGGSARQALAERADLVLVSGGDGTVTACAKALAGTSVPLGVVPSGTGNLLATALGLPAAVSDAVQVALHGPRQRIDLGTCGDFQFMCVVSMGIGAAVMRDVSPALKARTGLLAYLVSAVRHLRYPAGTFTISIDGQAPVTRRCHGVLAGNLGQVMTHRRPFVTTFDDGRLEVALLRIRPVMDWARHYHPWLQARQPPLEWFQGCHIEIEADRCHPVERDGDWVRSAGRLSIQALPRSLSLCVPAGGADPIRIRRLLGLAVHDAMRSLLPVSGGPLTLTYRGDGPESPGAQQRQVDVER